MARDQEAAIEYLLAACESEAECAFVHGLVAWSVENVATKLLLLDGAVGIVQGGVPRWFVIPQARKGRYRIDFLIIWGGDIASRWGGYAVEIDGHAWHERTHADAKAQRQRDRELARAGIFTLRFAAIDVLDDAESVFAEVEMTCEGLVIDDFWWASDLADAGKVPAAASRT